MSAKKFPRSLHLIPVLGLIIPAIVHLAPVEADHEQTFIATWTLWAHYASPVILIGLIRNITVSRTGTVDGDGYRHINVGPISDEQLRPNRGYMRTLSLRFMYGFAVLAAAIPHFLSWSLPLATAVASRLFNYNFNTSSLRPLSSMHPLDASPIVSTISSFLHRPPVSPTTLADRLHGFLVWAFILLNLSVLIWPFLLYRRVESRVPYFKIALLVVLAGPVAAAVRVMWEGEEIGLTRGHEDPGFKQSALASNSRPRAGSGMRIGKWERGRKILVLP
ncbi:uncharacterized protein BDV17DRAFT_295698 [Aspergillus undulatus]|uniref:uncharacterized protein n=1 Tax=Aspergillus undulatus TaxID=1810928 RepID=UPI003CCD0B53